MICPSERSSLRTPSCSCALPWPERDGGRPSRAASQRVVSLHAGPRSDVVRAGAVEGGSAVLDRRLAGSADKPLPVTGSAGDPTR